MTDWLLISCIASALIACGLGVTLFLNWRQDRAEIRARLDMIETERVILHGETPWNLER